MGYHHLHLSQQTEPSGYSKRTNDVLFAHVTRERFNAIGFFDHSVFERSDPALQAMTAERKRLWQVFEQRNSFGQKPGAVYLVNPIATSGHSLSHARLAAEFSNIVYSIDHRLDNVAERSKIFSTVPHDSVKAMKLQWHFDYLDFRLFDKTSSNFFVLKYGLL